MSSKRRPLQAMQVMVDQLPAPVQKKKRNSKKQQAAILSSSPPSLQHDSAQQYQQQQQQQQRAVESILPTPSKQTQVDYFPNPYQHMNPWTQAEQDGAITNYQNQWDRRQEEEEESVANILDDLIRDDTIEPQQEPQREPQQEPPQVMTVQEKKYDVTICPFHRCKLTTFEAWKSKELYIKCSVVWTHAVSSLT